MSQRAVKWVNRVSGVQRAERAALMILANLADGQGRLTKTVDQIAAFAGVSDRTIQRGIASLEGRGLLIREFRRSAKGRQSACLITLQLNVFQGDKNTPQNDDSRVSDCHPGMTRKSIVSRVRGYYYPRAVRYISPPIAPPAPTFAANCGLGEIALEATNLFVLADYRRRKPIQGGGLTSLGADNLISLVGRAVR